MQIGNELFAIHRGARNRSSDQLAREDSVAAVREEERRKAQVRHRRGAVSKRGDGEELVPLRLVGRIHGRHDPAPFDRDHDQRRGEPERSACPRTRAGHHRRPAPRNRRDEISDQRYRAERPADRRTPARGDAAMKNFSLFKIFSILFILQLFLLSQFFL